MWSSSYIIHVENSQQQNALGYNNLSMQKIGTVAIDRPWFAEFLRSRKEVFEVSQGGLARIFAVGLHSLVNMF